MKHRPELQRHTANWRRPTRSGVRRYRWSHRNSPRAPMEPNAWGDAPPQKRNAHQRRKPSAKTRCKRGDNVTGSINDTDAKKRLRARSGHSQRASAKPTAEADKATTKKERGMESERLRQGLQLRSKRERGDRPPKGKDQAEREELSPTRCRREDHSKCSGSPRAPRELSGRGRSLTRRRRLQAQKTTCRQEAEESRWTWKQTYSQGSTIERTKNHPRPAATVRTTRKEGASGRRAQS